MYGNSLWWRAELCILVAGFVRGWCSSTLQWHLEAMKNVVDSSTGTKGRPVLDPWQRKGVTGKHLCFVLVSSMLNVIVNVNIIVQARSGRGGFLECQNALSNSTSTAVLVGSCWDN